MNAKSEGHRMGTLGCYTLKAFKTYFEEEPVTQKVIFFKIAHHIYSHRAEVRVNVALGKVVSELNVSTVQYWTSAVLAFVSPFH